MFPYFVEQRTLRDQEYKSDLRKTLAKQLDSEFLSNLDDLTRPSPYDVDETDDDTGTVDPNELQENSALWKSLWSQGRGILNTDRQVDVDDLSEDDEDDDENHLEDAKSETTSNERTRKKSEVITLTRARKIKVNELFS